MPTENRPSSNHGTRTFTLDSLTAALEQVQAFHEISADLIAESVFGQPAQQGQGEPVALPARRPWNGLGNAADNLKASGWNACLDKIFELGPLYTHADPAEVERLREHNEKLREVVKHSDAQIMRQSMRISNQRTQLAEAQALLRRAVNGSDEGLGLDIEVFLSASAELSAIGDGVRDERDYAIEHAGYLADAADQVLADYQAYSLAQMLENEGGDDGDGEHAEAVDSAKDELHEGLANLRNMTYEFRKRRPRSNPTPL